MENCCRTCLKQNLNPNISMKLLSTKWNNASLSFADMLMDIVEVNKPISSDSEGDSLKICASCESDLITAYNFKIVCLNSEKIITNRCSTIIKDNKFEPTIIKKEDIVLISEKHTIVEEIHGKKLRGRPKTKTQNESNKITNAQKENAKLIATDSIDKQQPNKNPKYVRKPRVFCRKCDMKFETEPKYMRHCRDLHWKASKMKRNCIKRKPRVFCRKCNVKFETESKYVRHCRELHWESTVCTVCGKVQPKFSIEKHMISHTKQRNYICTICNAKFLYENNLKEHLRIHTGEKRYKCSYCDKTFIHSNSKKHHINTVHTEKKTLSNVDEDSTVWKPKKIRKPRIYCRKCDIKFVQEKEYFQHCKELHWITHFCTICGKSFLESRIKKHMIAHSKNPSNSATV